MALIRLPTEILNNIIVHTLPEGFESVALTCRKIYALCIPFIEHHNLLRSQFQDISYYEDSRFMLSAKVPDPAFCIRTAFDLIIRIAEEPVVARYIRNADFGVDSFFALRRNRWLLDDVDTFGGTLVRMLANSPYLEQAGLDCEEYYAKIKEEIEANHCSEPGRHYSQHAAAFLLTLLPNVRVLRLSRKWKPLDATDKLIDAVVRKAKQSHSPWDNPSLARVISFGPTVAFGSEVGCYLDWVRPFLALPHIRDFVCRSCKIMDDGHKSVTSKDTYPGFGETLEVVQLWDCCIDEVGIADFLKNAKHLRTLEYSHSTKETGGTPNWNICKFVMAIEQEVGSHLVELSVSIRKLRGSITPGEVSMRGFQRLRKLELPLDIALCNITAAARRVAPPYISFVAGSTHSEPDHNEPFIGDLVPATVSELSLLSIGMDYHANALDIIFRDFAAKKASQLPALTDIHLSYPANIDNVYRDQCDRLLSETEKVGVTLHLEQFNFIFITTSIKER